MVKCANENCKSESLNTNVYCYEHECLAGTLYDSPIEYYLDAHQEEVIDQSFTVKGILFEVFANNQRVKQVEYKSSPKFKDSYAYYNVQDLIFQSQWSKA